MLISTRPAKAPSPAPSQSLAVHPVQPAEIEALRELVARNANARVYLGLGDGVLKIGELLRTQGTLFGRAFWSRGYCVSTVGLDEAMIKQYTRDQEKHERDQERGLFD